MSQTIKSEMGMLAWVMLLVLSIVWGGSFFFNAILVQELPPITIVFTRVALAAVFLWLYIAAKNIPVPQSLVAWGSLLVMGLLNNVLPFGLIVWGQTIISSSLASILNATVPLMTVVLAALLLNDENISVRKTIGVVIGFIGTAWIIGPDFSAFGPQHLLAQLAILGAALSYTFAAIFGRRFSKMGLHPVTTAAGQVSASALLTLPFMLLIDKPHLLPMPSNGVLLASLALALISTAFAYILYFKILAVAGATNLGLVTFLIPVWATALGIGFLGETISTNQLIGVFLIAVGLSLIDGRIWKRRKANH